MRYVHSGVINIFTDREEELRKRNRKRKRIKKNSKIFSVNHIFGAIHENHIKTILGVHSFNFFENS